MYQLHIYGGEHIEETKDEFETEEAAMEEAERRCTDDTTGWEVKADGKVLIDYNNSDQQEDIVIHKVTEIEN